MTRYVLQGLVVVFLVIVVTKAVIAILANLVEML